MPGRDRGALTEASDPRPRRWFVLLVGLAVVAIFGLVWVFAALFSGFACSGDGGVPYAADDSTVGRLCDWRSESGEPLWLAAVALAPIGPLVGLVVAAVRRRYAPLAIGTAIGALLTLAFAAPFLALPDACSDSDQAVYERAVRSGSPLGPGVPDCEHY